ncbi:MAG: NADH-quinone oxidoreductase subunit A [Gammaproteobacteria bacterium]|nr:NADH-quinone oxidoreductase subunit A [Gammaproteobacteria bacterium]
MTEEDTPYISSQLLSFIVGGAVVSLLIVTQLLICSRVFHQEKFSSYECGFLPITKRRRHITLQFFMLLIIFIIFDLEVILLVALFYSHPLFLGLLFLFILLSLLLE